MTAKPAEFKGRCTGPTCGTDVLMRKLANGRYHPFDLPIPRCPECAGKGKREYEAVRSMFDGGGVETHVDICPTCKGKGEKPRSHFNTCPDADDFRTNKRGGVRATGEEEAGTK